MAEHIEDAKRGYYTDWLQTSPTLGIVVSLAVISWTRSYLGVDAFSDWGWRIPFIISLLLIAIYSGQFWALYFLQTVKKLDVLTSSLATSSGSRS